MFQKGEKLESFLGSNTHLKGEITTKGTLRIDGSVEGDVHAEGLIVGEKAHIKGNASATSIVVGGTVEGNVFAKGLVDIQKKGRVKGDIVTAKLTVVDGGVVDGRIAMQSEGAKLIEMSERKAEGHSEAAAEAS